MKRIFSPYRICPIGAHVDHQGGVVLGRTLNIGTTLDYEPLDSNEIRITSDQFGEAIFFIDEIDHAHWVRYAQAAANVLRPKRGMKAYVTGSLIGSGLSSSASVGLAYLKALADANGIDLTAEQLVQLDFQLEHDQLGLQNGLLDPMAIIYGKRDALLFMDTVTGSVKPILDSPSADAAWIVAYSGISRELTKSGFNVRVAECHEASSLLNDGASILCDVPRELFEEKKNALTADMYQALAEALARAEADPAVRVILISGAGGNFTAGNDLADFLDHPPKDEDAPVFRFLNAFAGLQKPFVAAVDGVAVGVGTTVLLHCDLVYAGASARFALPFANLGRTPEAASSLLLPLRAGHARAAEMLMLGEVFSAQTALDSGIVNAVLPDGQVLAHALERCRKLITQPAASLRLTKQLMKRSQQALIRETMGTEAEIFRQRLVSPEAKEAFAAFFEKRKPDFSKFA